MCARSLLLVCLLVYDGMRVVGTVAACEHLMRGRWCAAMTVLGNIRASSFRESLLEDLPEAERVDYESRFARRRS